MMCKSPQTVPEIPKIFEIGFVFESMNLFLQERLFYIISSIALFVELILFFSCLTKCHDQCIFNANMFVLQTLKRRKNESQKE